MRKNHLFLAPLLLTIACGGAQQKNQAESPLEMSRAPGSSLEDAYYPSELGPESESSRHSTSAPAEAGGAPPAPLDQDIRAEKSRPGLATSWGETRESRTSQVEFNRQSPSQPSAVVSFFYNDLQGARRVAGDPQLTPSFNPIQIAQGALSVSLVDSRGQTLPGINSGGRSHVIGRDGERYSIRIQNNLGSRVEVVTTVDGLDVIDGRPGSFEKRGYLIHPFSSLEIDGFRQSQDTVASFRFGSVSDSYAGKTGDARNVGVIGVAVFQEENSSWQWSPQELHQRRTADPFPGRFATPPPR